MSNRTDGTLDPPFEVGEKLPITANFTPQLPAGGSLSTCAVTAHRVSDGVDVTATYLTGAVSVVSPRATQFIHQAAPNVDFYVKFLGTMSDTRIVKVLVYIPAR